MSKAVQRRRGTTAEHTTFTGALGELTVDTTKDTIVVHDGAAAGGFPLLREDGSNSALALGSAGTPSLKFTGDPNTGLYSPGADQVAISTGGTGRLFVDASGNVSTGTSNVSGSFTGRHVLTLNGTSSSMFSLYHSGVFKAYLVHNGDNLDVVNIAAGYLAFGTSNTERLRIDSSGRLLVGTSTARSTGTQIWPSQIETASSFTGLAITANTNNTAGAYLSLAKSRGSAVGSNTIVQNGDGLGYILFSGADGTDANSQGAYIGCEVDGTPGANDMPGRLVFSTTADGAASPTEAMRINNQRELLIGTTTRTANGGVLQISNGITFPGTQSACSDANTLDDYEEGTFTPTIIGTSVAGTGTYTTQVGRYTKIGNRVRFTVYIIWTAHTGTGGLRASALPFTSNVTTSNFNAIAIYHSNVAMTAGNTMQAYVDVGNTQIGITQVPTGGGGASAVLIDTAGEIMLTGTYEV